MGLEGSAERGRGKAREGPGAIAVYVNIGVFYINMTFHMTFFSTAVTVTAAAVAAAVIHRSPLIVIPSSFPSSQKCDNKNSRFLLVRRDKE